MKVEWLEHSKSYRNDALNAPEVTASCALILTQLGESDAALDRIERVLAGPAGPSVHRLRLDPRWDPIRDHPRFQALVAKYSER